LSRSILTRYYYITMEQSINRNQSLRLLRINVYFFLALTFVIWVFYEFCHFVNNYHFYNTLDTLNWNRFVAYILKDHNFLTNSMSPACWYFSLFWLALCFALYCLIPVFLYLYKRIMPFAVVVFVDLINVLFVLLGRPICGYFDISIKTVPVFSISIILFLSLVVLRILQYYYIYRIRLTPV
jgi:hypothetical protein